MLLSEKALMPFTAMSIRRANDGHPDIRVQISVATLLY
jgi:hypothetical protein